MVAGGVEGRARRGDGLGECEGLARGGRGGGGSPPRCADDLRGFISTPDALGAWVAECDGGIVGHVALHPRGSPEVMARAADATGRSPEQLCVVARLFVSPSHRGKGLGRSLL